MKLVTFTHLNGTKTGLLVDHGEQVVVRIELAEVGVLENPSPDSRFQPAPRATRSFQ